jgi:hypothetical protein
VSEPAFSTSAAWEALKVKEFAKSALLTVTMYGPAADMVTVSAKLGIVPVDQFVATLQSPLVGFFQLIALIFSLPIFCMAVSGLHARIRGLIVQKQTKEDGFNWLGFSLRTALCATVANGPSEHWHVWTV